MSKFIDSITPNHLKDKVYGIFRKHGIKLKQLYESPDSGEFESRRFHPMVVQHAKSLFQKGEYFHAAFEAAKAFNSEVKDKSGLQEDGVSLMNKAFLRDKPVLHITPCRTETEKNIQDGYRFLAAGLMAAIRNPTAHEPALSMLMGRQEALEILGLILYLFRQLEKAYTSIRS
ncbi:MAG: TIGR02391 family protein [Bacteroidia bacterium]|nr:TIGR02391 family protein [Bacteroidia bacterium]